jgi:DNA modification methylase
MPLDTFKVPVLWVDINKITPNPKNRNLHSPEQIKRLVKLLESHGWRHPLVVSNRSKKLVAGHGRLLAAKEMKMDIAPVHYQDFDSEEEEFQFGIADNAIASWAELDLSGIHTDLPDLEPFDIDLLGIKDFEFEPPIEGKCDEDEVPETPKETTVRLGDLYQLGEHRVMCGDSTDKAQVERLMNGEKADMVFTDPPYNVDYDYNSSNDKRTDEEYRKFLTDVFVLCEENLAEDAYCYVKNAPRNLPGFFPIMQKWILNNLIVWPHSCQFHPSNRFSTNWEAIAVFFRGKPIFNPKAQTQEVTTPLRLKGIIKTDGRIDDVWHDIPWLSAGAMMAKETIRKPGTNSKAHPCQMPIALPERAIVFSSDERAKVLDPFSGSGSTLIACEKTKRRCFGIEIDPLYVQVIIDRWEKFTGKKAVKIG